MGGLKIRLFALFLESRMTLLGSLALTLLATIAAGSECDPK